MKNSYKIECNRGITAKILNRVAKQIRKTMKKLTFLSMLMFLVDLFVATVKRLFGIAKHMSRESHYGYSQFVAEAKSKISGAKATLNFWLALLQNSPTITNS